MRIIVALLFACGAPTRSAEPGPEAEPEPEAKTQPAKPEAAKPSAKKPAEFPGRFPGAEEDASVKLTWRAKTPTKVALYDKPRGKEIARRMFYQGGELEMVGTTLFVLEPIILTAKKPVAFEVAADGDKPATKLVLAVGDQLEYYHYGSEGSCYVGQDGVVVLIDVCPTREDFAGHTKDMIPVQEWWIAIEHTPGTKAWLMVDDKLIDGQVRGP